MTQQKILKELSSYLPQLLIIQLRLSMALEEPIQLCLCIGDVVHEYNGSREDEKTVSILLSALIKNHCSKYKVPEIKKPS